MGATAGAKTKEGAATGAAVGTAVGLFYKLAAGGDDPIGSMLAGAAVGAAAGATAGYIADQQTKKDQQ